MLKCEVQRFLIAMSYEVYSKGEGMDLEVMQSGNNVSFTLTATQRLHQRHYRLSQNLSIWR